MKKIKGNYLLFWRGRPHSKPPWRVKLSVGVLYLQNLLMNITANLQII